MKPTDEERSYALKAVDRMMSGGSDPDHLARCFNYLNERNKALEELFIHLERYLQFGTPSDEHAKLLILVQRLREQESSGHNDSEFV